MKSKQKGMLKSLIFALIVVAAVAVTIIVTSSRKSLEIRSKAAFDPIAQCGRVCDLIEEPAARGQCKLLCPKFASGELSCGNLCTKVPAKAKNGCNVLCSRMSKCTSLCSNMGSYKQLCLDECRDVETGRATCAEACSAFPSEVQSKCNTQCTKVFP